MSIYDFYVQDIDGKLIDLNDFKGKTLLIVNTATKCSLTPQYSELEALYQKYQDKGLVILDFPSDEFKQTPESNDEIAQFLAEYYQISFPVFAKISINGDDTHPLYAYLKAQNPKEITNSKYDTLLEVLHDLNEVRYGNDIKWNFTKFLVNSHGDVTHRFAPTVTAKEMERAIQEALVGAA